MLKLLIATRNRHKVGEIQTILGEGFDCLTLEKISGAPEILEDAETFEGNARKKAEGIAAWLKTFAGAKPDFVMADDSGLEVDALGGAPGVHSARFAALDSGGAGNSADVDNNAKLLRLLKDVPLEKRGARFRCVIALVELQSGSLQTFTGTCEGRIEFAKSGAGGFGYDPLFTPIGFNQTFAELGEAVKNQISHRAQALAKLRGALAPRISNCSNPAAV